jgi:hypothetical protein
MIRIAVGMRIVSDLVMHAMIGKRRMLRGTRALPG